MKTCRTFVLAAFFFNWPWCRFCDATPVASRTYYISSTSGNDNNDGQSPEKAWKNLSKIYLKSISKDSFQPGDTILLKRGDQWDGQIRLQANGTAQNPITLGAYGQGLKPLIYGDNPDAQWESVAGQNGIYTTDMGRGSILGSILLDGKTLKTIYPAESLNRTKTCKCSWRDCSPDLWRDV